MVEGREFQTILTPVTVVVTFNALSYFQCFDTVAWVAGRASGL